MGGADVATPPAWRDYLLASTFGYTPDEIDQAPAARLDWLIACHNTLESVKAEKAKEAERRDR